MIDLPEKIIIPEGNKKHMFDINKVKFIKADRYYVNVFCLNKKVLIRITMKKLKKMLPSLLIRINKSILINFDDQVRIEESKSSCCLVLSGVKEQQVSEKYKIEFDNFFSKKIKALLHLKKPCGHKISNTFLFSLLK